MRTGTDVLLSLTRHAAAALGEEWEVRPAAEEGTFGRPAAQVTATSPQAITGSRRWLEIVQGFAIYAYPAPADSIVKSLIAVGQAEESLIGAFQGASVGEARTAELPLYDYDGVGEDQSSAARRPSDFARLTDFNVTRTQNPDDERLWSVLVELRLRWTRDAEPSEFIDARLVRDVRASLSTP